MKFRGNLIIEREEDWCIQVADENRTLPKTSDVTEIASIVSGLLANSKGVNPDCIIAPASTSCFFSRLNLLPDFDIRDRHSLIYELENHLPIDAESMAADFATLPASHNQNQTQPETSVSAIAVEVNAWKSLADNLEAEGIPVTNIIPSAALAVASLHEKHSLSGISNVIICHGDHADMITLTDDQMMSWKYSKIEAASLQRHKCLDLPESDTILVVGCTKAQGTLIRDNIGPIQIEPEALVTHQLQGANTAISKPASTHFNLRRDALASDDPLRPITKQLSWFAFAVAICLIAMILGSWWRSTRIEERITENLQAQGAAFKEAFPNTRVPAALLRRVRSEHSRIMGSRNASKQIEAPTSATEMMGVLLASLPTDTRVRISSIDIRDGNVDLRFQVQRPVDAGVIAEALSQGGFDVSQPATTRKDAKTFESTIQAEWHDRVSANTSNSKGQQSVDRQGQVEQPSTHVAESTNTFSVSQPQMGAREFDAK